MTGYDEQFRYKDLSSSDGFGCERQPDDNQIRSVNVTFRGEVKSVSCQGRWTIIQNRRYCITSFWKLWDDYRNGFGSLETDLWLGNELVSYLTRHPHEATFDLVTSAGESRYAHYDLFRVLNETQKYKLIVQGYRGNAGDALNDPRSNLRANGSNFSTPDRWGCASSFKAGWWWNNCGSSGLNGPCPNQDGYNCGRHYCMQWNPLEWKTPLNSSRIRIRRIH